MAFLLVIGTGLGFLGGIFAFAVGVGGGAPLAVPLLAAPLPLLLFRGQSLGARLLAALASIAIGAAVLSFAAAGYST